MKKGNGRFLHIQQKGRDSINSPSSLLTETIHFSIFTALDESSHLSNIINILGKRQQISSRIPSYSLLTALLFAILKNSCIPFKAERLVSFPTLLFRCFVDRRFICRGVLGGEVPQKVSVFASSDKSSVSDSDILQVASSNLHSCLSISNKRNQELQVYNPHPNPKGRGGRNPPQFKCFHLSVMIFLHRCHSSEVYSSSLKAVFFPLLLVHHFYVFGWKTLQIELIFFIK